jgi:hypothetical protein
MTRAAWLMLAATWGVITWFTVAYFAKVLKRK